MQGWPATELSVFDKAPVPPDTAGHLRDSDEVPLIVFMANQIAPVVILQDGHLRLLHSRPVHLTTEEGER